MEVIIYKLSYQNDKQIIHTTITLKLVPLKLNKYIYSVFTNSFFTLKKKSLKKIQNNNKYFI